MFMMFSRFSCPPPSLLPVRAGLIFDGATNPVHPNTIGCIDPHCEVAEVVQGELAVPVFMGQDLGYPSPERRSQWRGGAQQ